MENKETVTKSSFILKTVLSALCTLAFAGAAAARPTVVELYTSQGCSSCPAAEAFVRELARDPALLALSFHVTYFDNQGWRDPFASMANTDRQKTYVAAMGLDSVYTPQMIVDGETPVVGSDVNAAEAAITAAEHHSLEIPVSISPQTDGNLHITIGGPASKDQVPQGVVAWEMHFLRGGTTNVQGGENGGAALESTNNVMRYVPMALAPGRQNDYLLPANFPEDGVAVIVQKQPLGRVIGAAVYMKPAPVTASLR